MFTRLYRSAVTFPLAVALGIGLFAVVAGQETTDGSAKKPAKAPSKSAARPTRPASVPPAFTPEREQAAMKFVREHHGDVADLLENLQESKPEQYRRAARDLFRSSERVSQWKDRDPARYELELKAWKINSRIQLLMARSAMSTEMSHEPELKSLIAERVDTRLAIRRHEREQLAKRLADADMDIARMTSQRDESIDKQVKQLKQKAKANRQRVKSKTTGPAKKVEAAGQEKKK